MSAILGVLCFPLSALCLYVFLAGLMGWQWKEAAIMYRGFLVMLSMLVMFLVSAYVGWGLLTEWGK